MEVEAEGSHQEDYTVKRRAYSQVCCERSEPGLAGLVLVLELAVLDEAAFPLYSTCSLRYCGRVCI